MNDIVPPTDQQIALATYDRMLAETRKFAAEQNKLASEAKKFTREIWIVPLSVFGAILAAVVARLPEILHALGIGQ